MKRVHIIVMIAMMMSSTWSCYYDKEETLYGRKADCASTSYTYTADVKPLIQQNCATTGCHDATNAGNVTLQSYTQVSETSSRINQRVAVDRTMPPGGLTSKQIAVIECWIINGKPQ